MIKELVEIRKDIMKCNVYDSSHPLKKILLALCDKLEQIENKLK